MRKVIEFLLVSLVAGLLALSGGQALATHPGTTVLVDGSDATGDGVFPYTCGDVANPCDTIQHGVDHASSGDTISVANGTYTEAVSITGKGVTIQGESEVGVIVQAAAAQTGAANTFTVNAAGNDVTIERMTIRNGDYGIRSSAGNVSVLNATIYHNGWNGVGYVGVPTQASAGADYAANATSGGAIRIENSASSEIAYNTVYENDRGIRFQDSNNGLIHDNISHDNIQAGIYLASSAYCAAPTGSTNTVVRDNESYGNMNNGILSIGGKNNFIGSNNVHDNWNTGVMLWCVAENTVRDNTINQNNLYSFNGQGNSGDAFGGGIAVDAATAVTPSNFVAKILCNTISNNAIGRAAQSEGIRIDSPVSADGIEITYNTFLNHDMDIHVQSQAATTVVSSNNFDGVGTGVQNDDAGTVNAVNNWWGAADGPSGVGPGSGDAVSANVDYTPWLAAAAQCPLPVGGISKLLVDSSDSPASAGDDGSGLASPLYAVIAAGVAATAVAFAVGGRYAHRRWLR